MKYPYVHAVEAARDLRIFLDSAGLFSRLVNKERGSWFFAVTRATAPVSIAYVRAEKYGFIVYNRHKMVTHDSILTPKVVCEELKLLL